MTLLRFFTLVSLVLAGTSQLPIFQAVLMDGQVVQGTLQISSSNKVEKHGEFRPTPASGPTAPIVATLDLREVRTLRNRSPFQTIRQIGPCFQFQLRGGERFSGEMVAGDPEEPGKSITPGQIRLPLLVRGETRRTISEGKLAGIATPENERLVFYQDFEVDSEAWTLRGRTAEPQTGEHRSGRRSLPLPRSGDALTCRLAQFPTRGRIQWQLAERVLLQQQKELKSKPEDRGDGWRLEIQLSDSAPTTNPSTVTEVKTPVKRWVVQTDGQSYTSTAPPELRLTTLPVARRPGWQQWTLRLSEDRTLLCVDGAVLAVGPALAQHIVSFNVQAIPERTQEAASEKNPTVWIDDFLVLAATSPTAELPLPRNTQPRELLWMTTGDELFGIASDLSPTGLGWKMPSRSRKVAWGSVAALLMHHPPVATADAGTSAATTRGWQAWVELSDGQWSHMRQPDRLWLALQELNGDQLVAEHALLGQLRIPVREVTQIEPQFFGERKVLETAAFHLGDETRDDFSVPIPGGSQLERTITLERLPEGTCYCSLQVEDLEPAGPQTPENSPNLATIQAGNLQTRLFVNGREIGDLNRHVSQRARAGQPLRVRVPLPAGTLQVGKNTFRLKQSPASDDPQNFDDCQVSQWAVDWEQAE